MSDLTERLKDDIDHSRYCEYSSADTIMKILLELSERLDRIEQQLDGFIIGHNKNSFPNKN